jgi:hypothetical protein
MTRVVFGGAVSAVVALGLCVGSIVEAAAPLHSGPSVLHLAASLSQISSQPAPCEPAVGGRVLQAFTDRALDTSDRQQSMDIKAAFRGVREDGRGAARAKRLPAGGMADSAARCRVLRFRAVFHRPAVS